MSLRVNLALLLFLACFSQLILAAEGIKGPGRKEKRQGSRGDNNSPVMKGKFTSKNQLQCSWSARGEDGYTLTVTCKPEKGDAFTCKYTAKPATCSEYASNPGSYWKQVARSLKKQKKLCADSRALLRAGMCKRAPEDAHFKLTETKRTKLPKTEKTPTTTNATTAGNEPKPDIMRKLQCKERSDHSELAKEKCGDSWASFCKFIFTLVQSEDC